MSNPVFLSHFDGANGQTTYTAETSQILSFVGGAHLDSSQKEFGATSLAVNGSTDIVAAPPSSEYDFGSGDFTIDCWAYLNESMGNLRGLMAYGGTLESFNTTDGAAWQLFVHSDQKLYFDANNGGSGFLAISTSTVSVSLGWHHFAAVRSGNTVILFVDGISVGTGDCTGVNITVLSGTSKKLTVGGIYQTLSDPWNGWVDEPRILKGVAAWTSNFTPPTQPYPNPTLSTTVIYDDFRGNTVDTNRWVQFPGSGSITQSAGLIVESGSNSWDVTGVISKNGFVKSNTSRVKFLCTQNNANVVGLQTQKTSLNKNDLICVDLQSHFYIFSASPTVDTGFTCSDGVEYEISFVTTGNDVSVVVNGGGYTDQVIYMATGIMTASTYYAAIQTYYAGLPFVCNYVSADLTTPPVPPLTIVYDDFDGFEVDTNKWFVFTSGGTVTQSSGQVHIADTEGWSTGIISKNSFPKATTTSIRILASMAGPNSGMVGLQLQNVTLDWTNFVSVECFRNLFYVYYGGWTPTAFTTVDNTEYEYNFAITGNDLNIYVSGDVYSSRLIGSLPGIMTASDYYPFLIAAENLDGNQVSSDVVATAAAPNLLSHFDGSNGQTTYTAETGQLITCSSGSQISTAQAKFGSASLYCPNATSWTSLPDDPGYQFGNNDFTIDLWAYLNEADGQGRILLTYGGGAQWGATGHSWILSPWYNSLFFQWSSNGSPVGFQSSPISIAFGWHHIAVVRYGSSFKMYLDGTSIYSGTITSPIYLPTSTRELGIGGDQVDVQYPYNWNGWIDEVRILNGTAAWTSDFTPPTQPYPNPGPGPSPAGSFQGLIGSPYHTFTAGSQEWVLETMHPVIPLGGNAVMVDGKTYIAA